MPWHHQLSQRWLLRISGPSLEDLQQGLPGAGGLRRSDFWGSGVDQPDHPPVLLEFVHTDHPATERFSIGPLKLLGDGALGARTAFLSRSYADEPGTQGLIIFTADQFDKLIGGDRRYEMQVVVHCIVQAMWTSLAILASMGLAAFLLLFVVVFLTVQIENACNSLGQFMRS